jgi:hypothetical protein
MDKVVASLPFYLSIWWSGIRRSLDDLDASFLARIGAEVTNGMYRRIGEKL